MSNKQTNSDTPSALDTKKPPNQTRSRITLVAMFLVFFAPIFLAMFMYRNLDLWDPSSTSNYGDLMMPVAPLAMLDAVDNDSKEAVGVSLFEKQWTLIFVGKNGCDLSCEASLFKVRQMRFLLGRELQRVQYMFLALDEAAAKAADALAEAHPRMTRATATSTVAEQQSLAFGDNPVGNFYLIDPHGNLVMRYSKEAEVEGILKDLHKLLKVSKIG